MPPRGHRVGPRQRPRAPGRATGYPDATNALSVQLHFYEGLDLGHRFTVQAVCDSAPGVEEFDYVRVLFSLGATSMTPPEVRP